MFDKITKALALLLLAIFVYSYWLQAGNDRYRYSTSGDVPTIFDTRTGTAKVLLSGKWVALNQNRPTEPPTGFVIDPAK